MKNFAALLSGSLFLRGCRLCLLLCVPLWLSSQAVADGPVWRVSSGDSELYIGGTIHLLAAADYPLPVAFDRAFARADRLVLETDMRQLQSLEYQQQMLRLMTYSDGQTLKQQLSVETYRQLQQHLASRGVSEQTLLNFKPAMVAIMLTMMELQRLGLAGVGVDQYYSDRAVAQAKPQGQLETVEQQLAFIGNMARGQEDTMIAYTLQDIEQLPQMLAELKSGWRSGDLDKLEQLGLATFSDDFPELYQALLVDRNRAWLPQLKAMLANPETELVLVGALHLVGEQGVLAMLKRAGYSVERFTGAH